MESLKTLIKEVNEYIKLKRRKEFTGFIQAQLMHLLAVHLHICFLLFEKLCFRQCFQTEVSVWGKTLSYCEVKIIHRQPDYNQQGDPNLLQF